jgi:two-component system sensor histidine kinase CiaH
MDTGAMHILIWMMGAFVVGAVVSAFAVRAIYKSRAGRSLTKTKDEFVALASHYLLTPISIIQGGVAQLEEQDATLTGDGRHKLYELITKGQQRLWILAEQFVLVSQIEDGGLRLKLEAVNLRDTAQNALTSVDIFAREKSVHLELIDETKAIQEARLDARRVKQAIIALLDNAIKFSPEGAKVTIKIIQEAHSLAVEVGDNGIGMTSQAITTATQRFSRGTSSYTFDHEGIGLGLYTANAIVREHGGELTFDTSRKRGTTVTLRFPSE